MRGKSSKCGVSKTPSRSEDGESKKRKQSQEIPEMKKIQKQAPRG